MSIEWQRIYLVENNTCNEQSRVISLDSECKLSTTQRITYFSSENIVFRDAIEQVREVMKSSCLQINSFRV